VAPSCNDVLPNLGRDFRVLPAIAKKNVPLVVEGKTEEAPASGECSITIGLQPPERPWIELFDSPACAERKLRRPPHS